MVIDKEISVQLGQSSVECGTETNAEEQKNEKKLTRVQSPAPTFLSGMEGWVMNPPKNFHRHLAFTGPRTENSSILVEMKAGGFDPWCAHLHACDIFA